MQVGSGDHRYEWIDNWAKVPDTESARSGWAHHGVVVTEAGDIIAYHPGDPTVLVFDRDGNLLRSWETDFIEGHGLSLVKEGGTEYLWFADIGRKRVKTAGYDYVTRSGGPRVVKMTLDGSVVMRLQRPDLAIYQEGTYSPTWVAVNEERCGGNGDVWVADGYGQNYVHRYSKSGAYLGSINGEEGRAGAFTCPHGIWVDTRKSEPELYVADRSNRRVQVYDLEGKFKRVFGADFLTSPSGFVAHGDRMFVVELRARLAILDAKDGLVGYLGENDPVCGVDGWPNMKNANGNITRTSHLQTGKFNSPHGLAVDADGNLYVAEWLIGGRMTKLARV